MNRIFLASLLLLSVHGIRGTEAALIGSDAHTPPTSANGGAGSSLDEPSILSATPDPTIIDDAEFDEVTTPHSCIHITRNALKLTDDYHRAQSLPQCPLEGIKQGAVFLSPGTKKDHCGKVHQQDNFAYIVYKDPVPLAFVGVFDGHGPGGGNR